MTLRYVYDCPKLVAREVARMIPHCDPRGFPANSEAIGIINDEGRLIAGIVYYNFNPAAGTIEMAAAVAPAVSCNWLTRDTIRRAFAYAFGTRGCQMVIMRVRMDNKPLWSRLAGFGFELAHVPRLYGRDAGGLICTLTVERWIEHPIYRKRTPMKEAA